jgi:hypothetical protein
MGYIKAHDAAEVLTAASETKLGLGSCISWKQYCTAGRNLGLLNGAFTASLSAISDVSLSLCISVSTEVQTTTGQVA